MYINVDDTEDFIEKCEKIYPKHDGILLILLARENESVAGDLIEALNDRGIRFIGGIVPALIEGRTVLNAGAIVQSFNCRESIAIASIDGANISWATPPSPKFDTEPLLSNSRPTVFVLVDFACVRASELLEEVFDIYGDTVNYFGAGCGNGDRSPGPVIFSPEGLHTGAAVVAKLETPSQISLRHGWARNSDPVVATKTKGNVISELNWRPAMDVYREIVGDDVADSLTRGDDVPEAKRYPFGISREDLEDVVRDPVRSEANGDLVVLSGVPEHSLLHVMRGEDSELIDAAAELAKSLEPNPTNHRCLLFDCFSRAKLLGGSFDSELDAFVTGLAGTGIQVPVEGALALGEIASDGSRLPDFHNKTITACLFEDE